MRFRSVHTQLRNRPAYMATRENSPSAQASRIGPGKQALRQVGQVSRFLTGSRLFIPNPIATQSITCIRAAGRFGISVTLPSGLLPSAPSLAQNPDYPCGIGKHEATRQGLFPRTPYLDRCQIIGHKGCSQQQWLRATLVGWSTRGRAQMRQAATRCDLFRLNRVSARATSRVLGEMSTSQALQ